MNKPAAAWQHPFARVEDVASTFAAHDYIAERALCLITKLAFDLGKPVLLEGEAGVGKTEVAKVLAAALDTPLIRLQCYEGLDASTTLYEWNYAVRSCTSAWPKPRPTASPGTTACAELSSNRRFLVLSSCSSDRYCRRSATRTAPSVLLIDEIDRADEEFEAFLLEILSDYQITVPEIGTFVARQRPCVILTSNRTRELNDALKRRCLYLWIDYPTRDKERDIILKRVPGIDKKLALAIAKVMQALREVDFYKRPGVAEALDWARALLGLDIRRLAPETLLETAGVVLKYRDDISRLETLDFAALLDGRAVER